MTRDPHTNLYSSSGDGPRNATSAAPSGSSHRAQVMNRILAEAASGHCDRAVELAAGHAAHDAQIANAQGVCLMRLGRVREAVGLYRSLLVAPGGAFLKSDQPAYLKLNYATALLLAGQPDACLDVLQEVDARNTIARHLRDAVQRWETTLSFSQKLDWWINRVAPSRAPVSIDFTPGEFGPVDTAASPTAGPVLPAQSPPTTCDTVHSSLPS